VRCVPKNARLNDAGQNRPAKSKLFAFSLQHCGGQRPVLPFVEDSLRSRNARATITPARFAEATRTTFLGNPPDDSPSRIIRIRRLCRNAWQALQNVSLVCTHFAAIAFCVQQQTHVRM
jgi:hypothetical protein